jgi:gas vesicle protein
MSVGKFFAGFIIGGCVGGVIGVLLAPRSGEETRQILAENSSELYKNAECSIKEIQSKADVALDEIQKKGDELLRKVQEMVNKEQA